MALGMATTIYQTPHGEAGVFCRVRSSAPDGRAAGGCSFVWDCTPREWYVRCSGGWRPPATLTACRRSVLAGGASTSRLVLGASGRFGVYEGWQVPKVKHTLERLPFVRGRKPCMIVQVRWRGAAEKGKVKVRHPSGCRLFECCTWESCLRLITGEGDTGRLVVSQISRGGLCVPIRLALHN